jgi:hypothetical protein
LDTEPVNPWLAPLEPESEVAEPTIVVRPRPRPRPRPRRLAGIPELADGLPRRELTGEERLVPCWCVGAHGGAGTSSIAALMAPVGDGGVAWPIAPDGEHARVLLVARESYTGLSAARRALTEWVGGGVPVQLEGLLLVAAQPGGTPKQLRELSELVRSQANSAVWRLGWQRAWLTGEATMPSEKTLRDVHEQLFDTAPKAH